jgi:predicted  nucleic acid-binding Zn-ribbon protein
MHYLTIEERERLAYAEGYTETAAVLGQIDDLQRALGEEAADLLHLDDLQKELDEATDARDAAQSGLDEIGCRWHDTRAELELTRDKLKTYRSALMAIEAEVPAHIRQFIREVLA